MCVCVYVYTYMRIYICIYEVSAQVRFSEIAPKRGVASPHPEFLTAIGWHEPGETSVAASLRAAEVWSAPKSCQTIQTKESIHAANGN